MGFRANIERKSPLKIGIIGAGFSGTALAATLHKLCASPIEIYLFEKRGAFGVGDAYSSPYPFHLLNVRARDMSAFEDAPLHYVEWLQANAYTQQYFDNNISIADQFTPRFLYGDYLKSLLANISDNHANKIKFIQEANEVTDIIPTDQQLQLLLNDERKITVDKVVLALGNNPPIYFPFPVAPKTNCIANPWDYKALEKIPADDPVLIVGTGLSMIDAVLTLHHQKHKGVIHAVSRHGLLPLAHADSHVPFLFMQDQLPKALRSLTKQMRLKSQHHLEAGGDWRSVVNALRVHLPMVWQNISTPDKKRFLRHVLPYWNIHRHRVNNKVAELLEQLSAKGQLNILSGRVLGVENNIVSVRSRKTNAITNIKTNWLINCIGPSLNMNTSQQPIVNALLQRGFAALDSLQLGFDVTTNGAIKSKAGIESTSIYTIGSLRRGVTWECTAVPEIRKQNFDLANTILNDK